MSKIVRVDPAESRDLLDEERAKAYLARADRPDVVKDLRDRAGSIQLYLRRQGATEASIRHAANIKVRCERRLGELTRDATKATGARGIGPKANAVAKVDRNQPPTLADQGLDKRDVSKWQRLAELPEKKFEAKLGEMAAAHVQPSTSRILGSVKQETVRAKLESTAAMKVKKAAGVYDVLVIDPPWPMEKVEREVRPNQAKTLDYPTMSEAELSALALPAAPDCHVWLWTTQRFFPMAFRLLEAWGLTYCCTFVWHKPGGFQVVGLPQYNCEFALYARRGSPIFVDTKSFATCFNAPRGAHSEKPSEFYNVARRVTAGRRLDMFNRRVIEGFDGWGKEAS